MKNSFTIFELLLTTILSSIIIIYLFNFSKQLVKTNKEAYKLEIQKTDLLSTKIFLQKHKNKLSKLEFKERSLYFKDTLLLDNIYKFNIKNLNNTIEIEINLDNKIKQKWIF